MRKFSWKRSVAFLLALVMLVGIMPMAVFAEEEAVTDDNRTTISILGDSISTFDGYIPEGNATYYPTNYLKHVEDTWWMQLITELDAKLGVNESWSGSCVSVTSGARLPMSSLARIQNLDNNGTPNVIVFFGGTNDIAFFSERIPVGSFDAATAPVQADLTQTEWENFADSYVAAILRMRYYYPEARIVSILPTVNTKYYNDATLEQYNSVLRAICTHYGVEYVDLVAEGYTTKLLGDATHPNAAGMDFITAAVKEKLQPEHSHSYSAVVTAPTCTEQGFTTYICDCGDSYVDDYMDATGEHIYENGVCTGCGAEEPEIPEDCSEGHIFGDWSEYTAATCQKRYVRECGLCGEKLYAKDIVAQTVSFAVPAITANVGDLVDLALYSVAFDAASVIPAAELAWTGESVENGYVIPAAAGVYALTASAGDSSKTVYLVVKNPEDTEYVLYYDGFDSAELEGYRGIEVPSGAEYYVSDGKLILDAGTNSANHMRVLLPEWIGDFGDYEITTSFSMLSAVQNTYWFATMARIQNEDYPYWQAAIRQNASAANGVEISTRTKASGATGGWNVTNKTAFSEKLSASKYYTQTFGLSGVNGFHAVNGTTLLESNSITNTVGDVGFHLRASKVAVDSVKIVIASNETSHNFGAWTVTQEASCTEAGMEMRVCSRCGAAENQEIAAGHSLTKYEQKLPTCTEPGWKAYEACSRCDYTTYVELAATGHTFEREIRSVAHRGYSDVAPENTLVAYEMAKEQGFRYVECDISLTKDKKAVLLHDDTIDRTSNGTGKITGLTYEQLLQYDFGSWKGEEFVGTKIPTLEEFLALCVELNLYPYIELKSNGGYSKSDVQALVSLVENYGLQDHCTWISFNATYLGYIKAAAPAARLGYLRRDNATQTVINTAKGLRTGENEVFLDLAYDELTTAGLLRAQENGFAVEVWTVDDANTVKQLPAYISGVTSNMLVAEAILKNAQVTPPTCGEQGYTTYTCICGETSVGNYVEPTGEHIYENGICTGCGEPQSGPIVITKQPAPADALVGEKAVLTVEAQGEGLEYQWYFRNTPTGSLSKSTITGNVYGITVTKDNANRVLYCVITDAHGNKVTTETVNLIEIKELSIAKQPADASAVLGQKATVTVEAAGNPVTYTWYFRDAGSKNFQRSTLTGSSYSLTMTEDRAGREVYCVIADAHGNQVTTETATLKLAVKEELKILTQPVPDDAIVGEKATISVEAQGDALKYTWYFKDAGKTTFTKSTITSSTYCLMVKESNANRVLYCVITDAHGNQVTTDTVNLIQVDELAILKQPMNTSAVLGEKVCVAVEAAGYPLTYTWYFRDAGAKNFQRSSITDSVYTLTMTEERVNREVYCVVSDAHGNQVTTDTVTLGLAVKEELRIITQPVPDDAGIGEKATISVVAQGDALKYAWYFKDAGKTSFTKSTITSSTYTLTVKESNVDRVLYCVLTDIHGNQVTTDTVSLIRNGEEEDPATYYGSLADALSGTAGSQDPTGAVAKVLEESGETVVVLLQDLQLAETLTIARVITLDLNGFTIASTAAPAVSVDAENAMIRGGEISLTASGKGTSGSPAVAVLAKSGTTLEIRDAKVTAVDEKNGTVVGVLGQASTELKLSNTTVLVTAETSLENIGVHAKGTAVLRDCTVIAESDYTANKAGNAYAASSRGIRAEKHLELYNCYVWGAHAGVLAMSTVYVDGGTYEGYGHGSFYFGGSNTTSYIYNASVNWAEMREGTYADSVAGTNGAGLYVGNGAKNVNIYMDNCQVYGTLYGIVLRNSGGEKNNSIYISNSTFTGCSKYAYRNGQNANYTTLKIYNGVGNDYSAIKGTLSVNPKRVIDTNESYAPNSNG